MTEYIVNPEEEQHLFYGRKYEELVRCKDCIHFCKARSDDECDTCSILFEMVDCPLGTNENKYCAWAERKTDDA